MLESKQAHWPSIRGTGRDGLTGPRGNREDFPVGPASGSLLGPFNMDVCHCRHFQMDTD